MMKWSVKSMRHLQLSATRKSAFFKMLLLTTVILSSFVSFADEPAAERETDLPAGLVDALNGINLPKGLPDLISDWATKTISDKNKRCFFNSFAKLLEILEDPDLNSTLGELGYTLWEGDTLHISGFFNESTTNKPNGVMSAIFKAVNTRLQYAIETDTYNSRSLEDCAKDENWTDDFQLDYSIAGFDVFSTDYYIDRGDLNIIIAAMRALRAGLNFLYAQDLNSMTIPEMIDMIGGFAGDGTTTPTFVEVFTRVGEFLKKVSVRKPLMTYKTYLSNAQTFITTSGVIPDMERGDAYIRNSRVDAHKHLFGQLTETGEPAHAIAYDPNNSIIALIRDHAAVLKEMFTKTGDNAPLVYTSWFKGVLELPDWLERDSYRVTLAPVFSTTIKWADILPPVRRRVAEARVGEGSDVRRHPARHAGGRDEADAVEAGARRVRRMSGHREACQHARGVRAVPHLGVQVQPRRRRQAAGVGVCLPVLRDARGGRAVCLRERAEGRDQRGFGGCDAAGQGQGDGRRFARQGGPGDRGVGADLLRPGVRQLGQGDGDGGGQRRRHGHDHGHSAEWQCWFRPGQGSVTCVLHSTDGRLVSIEIMV